jgi:arylsulfatase A-like enzyme
MLHWIDGKDCAGSRSAAIPALFGMSFASVAAAQSSAVIGYVDGSEKPSPGVAKSLRALDDAMARIIAELKATKLYDSTWIVVAGPYGQTPVRRVIPLGQLSAVVKPAAVAHIRGGDVALIWLREPTNTPAVVKALRAQAESLGIADVYYGARLGLTMNPPADDPRMPDIVLQPVAGVLWSNAGDASVAAHGGMSDSDVHVALLVSGKQLTGRADKTPVPTTQLAPLLLRAFGMEKFDLWALHPEHTPALPGIF